MRIITSILVSVTALCVGPVATAGDPPASAARQFSKDNAAPINAALAEFATGRYDRAIPVLSSTLELPGLTPYERATIGQMLGQALYETHDYKGAIRAFEDAIQSGGLLPKEQLNLEQNIAQLLIASGALAKGAEMLEAWQEHGGQLMPRHIEYLWQAWAQAEQYDRALPWAQKWFDAASPKTRKHYDVLNFLYARLNMTKERESLLQEMATRWPADTEIRQALAIMTQEN